MRIRFAIAAAVAVVALSVSTTVYAASSDTQPPVHSMLVSGKIVKFSLRNDSGSPVEVKAGDQVMSLDAGKTVVLKLTVGTKVVLNTAVHTHPAGELLAEVNSDLSGATIAIK